MRLALARRLRAAPSGLLPQGSGRRGVAVLVAGSVTSQILVAAATPLLARLYEPAEYGVLAAFAALLGLVSVPSTLRFDTALQLPEDERTAVDLLLLALASVLAFAGLAAIAGSLLERQIGDLLGTPGLADHLWLLPVAVAGAGTVACLEAWAVRARRFAAVARSTVARRIGMVTVQVGLGAAGAGSFGLVLGDAVGRGGGVASLASQTWQQVRPSVRSVSRDRLRRAASRYRRFPLISSWSGVLNAAGLTVPPLLVGGYYGGAVLGLFGLASRLLVLPVDLVGKAVGQVYLSEVAEARRTDGARARALFDRTARRLFLIGLVPVVVLAAAGPVLFETVLGSSWGPAGRFARLLAPMLLVQLVAVPLSITLGVFERQVWGVAWVIGRLSLVVGSMVIVAGTGGSAEATVAAYGTSMSVAYVAQLALSRLALQRDEPVAG